MPSATQSNLDSIPVGELGIIALQSSRGLGERIDGHITSWRKTREHEHLGSPHLLGYDQDTFLIPVDNPRFGSGEGKGVIFNSVRGKDLYLLVDVCNYSITYNLNGIVNHMSPDNHFQDLKRIISAANGKQKESPLLCRSFMKDVSTSVPCVNPWTARLHFRSLWKWA